MTTKRTKKTEKTDAFGFLIAALAALYGDEILRLVDVYRPRILAGEFSGDDKDGPRHLHLSEELARSHPWLQSERGAWVVSASSRWFDDHAKAMGSVGPDDGFERGSEQCMAHDILRVAAERGWVKRMRHINDNDTYALLKAARP